MNKFYNLVLLVMSWLFLVAAVVILINLLFMTNGEMKAMGVTMVGAIFSTLFFAALSWVALKTSKYIDEKKEAEEMSEE